MKQKTKIVPKKSGGTASSGMLKLEECYLKPVNHLESAHERDHTQ
jgi:hypothetical protein